MMAALVIGAMLLLLVGLSSGAWAHASFVAGDGGRTDLGDIPEDQRLDVDLAPTGRVRVERGDTDLSDDYDAGANASERAVLATAVPGSLRGLVQVVAVLVIVIAAVGTMRPLTQPTWALVAAAALGCLVATVILRDQVTAALSASAARMELGSYEVHPSASSALTVAAAAAGTLAAALAAGPRPMRGAAPAAHPLAAGTTAATTTTGAPATGDDGFRRRRRPGRPRTRSKAAIGSSLAPEERKFPPGDPLPPRDPD